jgi:uncharacterized membrane protein HdeD (DUF308 family)
MYELKRQWGWLLGVGILLVLLGTIAATYSFTTTILSVLFVGWLLVITGAAQTVQAVRSRNWNGFFLHLLAAILDVVAGVVILLHPEPTAVAMTFLLAAFLLAGGAFRAAASLSLQFPGWGWAMLSGLISIALGAALISQWPASGFWFIGFCVGLDMMFNGWATIMFALGLRQLPEHLSHLSL